MKFILPLLFVFFSHGFAQEMPSSIIVADYATFLAATPDADQYYDSATMRDQIECIFLEEGEITYHIVKGQEDQPMLGLTNRDIESYQSWAEFSQKTDAPLMMFFDLKEDPQRKKERELQAEQERSRSSTSRPNNSSSSYAQGNDFPQISESEPLLKKTSQSQHSSQSPTKSTLLAAANQQSARLRTQQRMIIGSSNNQNQRVSRSLGTPEERQSLLGSTSRSSTSSSTLRSVNPSSAARVLSPVQRNHPCPTRILGEQQSFTKAIRRLEDVPTIDHLINMTPGVSSTKEKEQPPFDGAAPRILLFPQRVAAYLFFGSLGSKIKREFIRLKSEQTYLQRSLPTLNHPITDDQIPSFLQRTQRWIDGKKNITELSQHFLNRVIDVQDRKLAQVDALSPHLLTALKYTWLHKINTLLDIHTQVKNAESLGSRIKKSPRFYTQMHFVERMRKWSDNDTEQFLQTGETLIYFCEKSLSQKISNQNSRLQLLQIALTMKEHLEGLHKIVVANTTLSSTKSEAFTRSENGDLELMDDAKKQSLIAAAEEARDAAYHWYQRPTFNRQQALIPDRAQNCNETWDNIREIAIDLFTEMVLGS